jgi:hypothetical protein
MAAFKSQSLESSPSSSSQEAVYRGLEKGWYHSHHRMMTGSQEQIHHHGRLPPEVAGIFSNLVSTAIIVVSQPQKPLWRI